MPALFTSTAPSGVRRTETVGAGTLVTVVDDAAEVGGVADFELLEHAARAIATANGNVMFRTLDRRTVAPPTFRRER
jgi:hypothetical protein